MECYLLSTASKARCGGELSEHASSERRTLPPIAVLDRKMVKKNNTVAVYGLIQWANGDKDDATWESLEDLVKRFPMFDVSS
ncbi:hypothetical protein CTI12_AA245140 [Artemisia annua]|uniref:Chromo domain-containing protein n=1 Tax=Artemisia annua TaxID=35608 RepID=A0A2U1MYG9_ARTAN|nr:hypothetical protein CTI12_AA245140 [Artemisia annua]